MGLLPIPICKGRGINLMPLLFLRIRSSADRKSHENCAISLHEHLAKHSQNLAPQVEPIWSLFHFGFFGIWMKCTRKREPLANPRQKCAPCADLCQQCEPFQFCGNGVPKSANPSQTSTKRANPFEFWISCNKQQAKTANP